MYKKKIKFSYISGLPNEVNLGIYGTTNTNIFITNLIIVFYDELFCNQVSRLL